MRFSKKLWEEIDGLKKDIVFLKGFMNGIDDRIDKFVAEYHKERSSDLDNDRFALDYINRTKERIQNIEQHLGIAKCGWCGHKLSKEKKPRED